MSNIALESSTDSTINALIFSFASAVFDAFPFLLQSRSSVFRFTKDCSLLKLDLPLCSSNKIGKSSQSLSCEKLTLPIFEN